MKSLEQRFLVGLTAVLMVAFSLLLWGAVSTVKNLSETYVMTRLEHDAEALLSALVIDAKGNKNLSKEKITPIYLQPLSGHYYQFDFPVHTLKSPSLWDGNLATIRLSPGDVGIYRGNGPGQQHLLLRSAGYEKSGRRFTLTVAEDLDAMRDQIHWYQSRAVLLFVFAGFVIILIQAYILRRGFRVLDRIRVEVHQASAGELQYLQTPAPAEIQPLTTEINRLLQQLQRRLKRSREALGNLAHALKGPLSLMTHDIDHLDISARERQALLDKLGRISTLIDRELKRARLAGEDIARLFIPEKHVHELVDALHLMHHDRPVRIHIVALPETALPFDHEDMMELLGNLLDNACKWARQSVHLQISLADDVEIRVADDGPGIAPECYQELVQRGRRLDEQQQGHGLGLAIVNDLVKDYGGEIQFSKSDTLGGLEVMVRLPFKSHD